MNNFKNLFLWLVLALVLVVLFNLFQSGTGDTWSHLAATVLPDYIASRAELVERAAALFEVVRSGQVRIEILQRYALKDAAQAHRDLEARKTTGSTVLLP